MRRVAVIADDFGMCNAINRGVMTAMSVESVTQVSVMTTTPGTEAALELIQQEGIPCAVHLVLAAEWDRVRWEPLTEARTLRAGDGCFPAHPDDLAGVADQDEIIIEWLAQIQRAREARVDPLHLDVHVALRHPAALAAVCRATSLATREPLPDDPELMLAIDSLFHLSPLSPASKKSALLDHLRCLENGNHVVVVHPACDDPELEALCSHRWPGRRRWATSVRTSDLECLMDTDVRRELHRPDVQLTTTHAFPGRTHAVRADRAGSAPFTARPHV